MDRPTNITKCDICGDEITDEQKQDPEMVARIFPYGANEITPITLPDFRVVKFDWPPWKGRMARREEMDAKVAPVRRGENWDPLYERNRAYDFHAECLAGLLDAAVDLREARETKARRAAETEAKRNAKIIERAEQERIYGKRVR